MVVTICTAVVVTICTDVMVTICTDVMVTISTAVVVTIFTAVVVTIFTTGGYYMYRCVVEVTVFHGISYRLPVQLVMQLTFTFSP